MSYEYGLVQDKRGIGQLPSETLRERLERQRKQAFEHLQNIEKAIEFLDKNKGFEEFHDLVGKVGG